MRQAGSGFHGDVNQIIQEQPADVVVLGLGVAGGIVATELATSGTRWSGSTRARSGTMRTTSRRSSTTSGGSAFMRKFDHPLQLSTTPCGTPVDQFAIPDEAVHSPTRSSRWAMAWEGRRTTTRRRWAGTAPGPMRRLFEHGQQVWPDFLNAIQPNQDLEDWPMTYDEYDPYYVEWEKAWGVAGTNQGPLVPMSQNYPLPPHPITSVGQLFQSTTEAMGYNPYPSPTRSPPRHT